jgi:hypothetical protein
MSSIRSLLLTLGSCACLALIGSACSGEASPEAGGSGGSACPFTGAPGTQQRVGPFATQTTAWDRYGEAQAAGCVVSQGTFPCYDETFTRGYCFNVFFD